MIIISKNFLEDKIEIIPKQRLADLCNFGIALFENSVPHIYQWRMQKPSTLSRCVHIYYSGYGSHRKEARHPFFRDILFDFMRLQVVLHDTCFVLHTTAFRQIQSAYGKLLPLHPFPEPTAGLIPAATSGNLITANSFVYYMILFSSTELMRKYLLHLPSHILLIRLRKL